MNFYVETEFLARFVSTASFYRQSSISICIAAGADCSYFNKAITGGEANHFLAEFDGRRPLFQTAVVAARRVAGCMAGFVVRKWARAWRGHLRQLADH